MWEETIRILDDMLENVWGDKETIELDHIMDITVPVSTLPYERSNDQKYPRILLTISVLMRPSHGADHPFGHWSSRLR